MRQCLLSSMKMIQQHYISVWLLSYKEEGDMRSVCNMTQKAVINNLLSVKLDKLGPMHLQRNQRQSLYSGFKRMCITVESLTNKFIGIFKTGNFNWVIKQMILNKQVEKSR